MEHIKGYQKSSTQELVDAQRKTDGLKKENSQLGEELEKIRVENDELNSKLKSTERNLDELKRQAKFSSDETVELNDRTRTLEEALTETIQQKLHRRHQDLMKLSKYLKEVRLCLLFVNILLIVFVWTLYPTPVIRLQHLEVGLI